MKISKQELRHMVEAACEELIRENQIIKDFMEVSNILHDIKNNNYKTALEHMNKILNEVGISCKLEDGE